MGSLSHCRFCVSSSTSIISHCSFPTVFTVIPNLYFWLKSILELLIPVNVPALLMLSYFPWVELWGVYSPSPGAAHTLLFSLRSLGHVAHRGFSHTAVFAVKTPDSCASLLVKWQEASVFTWNTRVPACSATQSSSDLCHPVDCSPPDSSVHGIFQARIQEWIAIFYFKGSSWPRHWALISASSHWQMDSLQLSHLGSPGPVVLDLKLLEAIRIIWKAC